MKALSILFAAGAALISLAMPTSAMAEGFKDPYEMMDVVADKAFKRIKQEQKNVESNPEVLRTIVNEELLPYIDSQYAALSVIGRTINLREQPVEDFNAFVQAFERYMVASYAGALVHYRDQQVIVDPKRPIDSNIVSIRARVVEQGKQDINISLKFRKAKNSEYWQVFDMVAEGVSLLDSKRSELSGLLRQHGLVKVTEMLNEKAKEPIKITEPEDDAENSQAE